MKELKDKIHVVSKKFESKIKNALKPLESLDVNYFYYTSVTNQGHFSGFSNNVDWNICWLDEKLHLDSFYYLQPNNYKEGLTISLPFMEMQFTKTRKMAFERFNINYVLEITLKDHWGIESYGFSTSNFGHSTPIQFINDIPLLKLFFRKLKERNPDIFHQVKENEVNIANEIGPSFFKPSIPMSLSHSQLNFLKKIGVDLFSDLSKREKEVCHDITKGLTANDIAMKLSLSKRTVESYIENIKEKLNCFSKAELVSKCLDLESVGYI